MLKSELDIKLFAVLSVIYGLASSGQHPNMEKDVFLEQIKKECKHGLLFLLENNA